MDVPRPRTLDPSNLPAEPNLTTDPSRVNELVEEFKDRLELLGQSFLFGRVALANDKVAFNDSLKRLRRSLARKRKAKRRGKRLHPEVEMVITHHAKKLAASEGAEVVQRHVELAGHKALEVLKPRRGRGDDRLLDHHVAGLVSLIQQYTGLPVLAYRTRNSVYDPHFAEGGSSAVPPDHARVGPKHHRDTPSEQCSEDATQICWKATKILGSLSVLWSQGRKRRPNRS